MNNDLPGGYSTPNDYGWNLQKAASVLPIVGAPPPYDAVAPVPQNMGMNMGAIAPGVVPGIDSFGDIFLFFF